MPINPYEKLCGWVEAPKVVEGAMQDLPFAYFSDVWTPIKGTGVGKTLMLTDIITKVAGKFPLRLQTIGDCVSMGTAYAVDAVKAVDIYLKGDWEEWIAETATEDIYGGSRVIIGNGQLSGDGSFGIWAAKYVNQYGALARGKYGNTDLSVYSGTRARKWGQRGVGIPDEIENAAKDHPIDVISMVTTYEQARDLVANGYPISICSNQGFSNRRDKDGFAAPSGSWAHCMCILGIDDNPRRPGVLVQNSWGVWNGGPKRLNQPDGSFFVDADVIQSRILSKRDSWAFAGYKGFEPKKLNTRIS